jgi:hypothetical protein
MEVFMNWNALHRILACIVTLVAIESPASAAPEAALDPAPSIVAQSAGPPSNNGAAAVAGEEFPAYQRGVRKAATEGPDALRRYVWRTRMIYNFNYKDFAPREKE